MSEFRQDIVTKEWVLIAPSRSGRPYEFKKKPAHSEKLPEVSPSCVFCPGNEKQTPAEILRYPEKGDWKIRVVPNKFGVLELDGAPDTHRNFYVTLPGTGSHEVLITRKHNEPTSMQSVGEIDLSLMIMQQRIDELGRHPGVKYVHVIQNSGQLAGASLVHPHSQIFAMPFLGPHIAEEIKGASSHYHIFDKCVYCQIIQHEIAEKVRIVFETENYVVLCPFESKMPFQMRILPKNHQARFHTINSTHRKELAAVLKNALTRLYTKIGDPSYNFYIHTLPFYKGTNQAVPEEAYHWHLVILPRVNIWAGLELGTEIYVNVMPPEKAAEYLRGEEL